MAVEETDAKDQTVDKTAVLQADGVNHRFGDLAVLNDVNLTVRSGSVTAIIGPNGSGKTTLIRILAGLLTPTSGRVRVEVDVERPRGYVPQENYFRPQLTVRETLQFYEAHLSESADAERMLQRVGLSEAKHRRIDALSGGMLRLLGVAQAVLGEPPVVLLDEPTSSLDPRMTRHIHRVAADIADSDTGVVLTTHDLYSAERVDRLLVLDEGEIVADDSPDAIKSETNTESLSDALVELVGEDPIVQTGRVEDG